MVSGVAINSLEIILILQPARSDVKIGPEQPQKSKAKNYPSAGLGCVFIALVVVLPALSCNHSRKRSNAFGMQDFDIAQSW